EIGIDRLGFASADVFTELKERLIQQEELQYASGFEKGTVEERTEPERLFNGAKSLISVAIAYPSRIPSPPTSRKRERRGMCCRASWREDYHHVLRRRLQKLADVLQEKSAAFDYNSMVDTGELNDAAVAERAGVGFPGKNTLLI